MVLGLEEPDAMDSAVRNVVTCVLTWKRLSVSANPLALSLSPASKLIELKQPYTSILFSLHKVCKM